MNRYQSLSLIILIGSPLLFLIVSVLSGRLEFFYWSLSAIAIALTLWKAGSNPEQ
ncbi:hypothetical protein [Pontibacillus salipaludis]|uniref:hypothetical protein n=1 Tax=Pontibacillus salipaludis TaxID=1697394 RepID=UPI0031EC01B0